MKNLFYLLLVTIALISCKKDEGPSKIVDFTVTSYVKLTEYSIVIPKKDVATNTNPSYTTTSTQSGTKYTYKGSFTAPEGSTVDVNFRPGSSNGLSMTEMIVYGEARLPSFYPNRNNGEFTWSIQVQ